MGGLSSSLSTSTDNEFFPEIGSAGSCRSRGQLLSRNILFGRSRREHFNLRNNDDSLHISSTSLPAACENEITSANLSSGVSLAYSITSFFHSRSNFSDAIPTSSRRTVPYPIEFSSLSSLNNATARFDTKSPRGIITVNPGPLPSRLPNSKNPTAGENVNLSSPFGQSTICSFESDYELENLINIPFFEPIIFKNILFSEKSEENSCKTSAKSSQKFISDYEPLYKIVEYYGEAVHIAAAEIFREQEEITSLQRKVASESRKLFSSLKACLIADVCSPNKSNPTKPSYPHFLSHTMENPGGGSAGALQINQIISGVDDLHRMILFCTDLLSNLIAEVGQLKQTLDDRP